MKLHPSQSSPQASTTAEVVFDVRPIPLRTKHAQIFQRWFDLPVGQYFVLLNDHDPVPLYYQFSAEFAGAFGWEYLEKGPEEFRVKITKIRADTGATRVLPVRPTLSNAPLEQARRTEMDMRGIEPPEPRIRILEALETLAAGATLQARTDREPCHLLGEAEQRGFHHDCKEQPDGSWITLRTHA